MKNKKCSVCKILHYKDCPDKGKNKSAQQLGKLGNKAQKKKHGKDYNKEMSRRIKVRWSKVKRGMEVEYGIRKINIK